MKRLLISIVGVTILTASAATAFAQQETDKGILVEKDILLLRQDLRGEKKKIIAMNVPLTDAEAKKFWPVYDEYANEMKKTNDEFYTIIKEYATNIKVLNDDQSVALVTRWSDAQLKLMETRKKYIPIFEKVIPGRKAALFFQVDRRLYALMDLQTVSEIPLVTQ